MFQLCFRLTVRSRRYLCSRLRKRDSGQCGRNIQPQRGGGYFVQLAPQLLTPDKYYNVFNIDQTDFAGKYPERYERMKKGEQPEDYSDRMIYEALDELVYLQNWYCPIKVQYSDSAYYSPSSDHIVCPQREQFPQGAEFYGTLLHEMAHSTGSPQRLNRTFGCFFGDALYAREELVAELTAALCGAFFGYATAPQENNAAYLKHWLTKLREEPAFLVEILGDVNKAAKMIADKVTEPINEPAAA